MIVINGGDPLPGCPESWDEARQWESRANDGKDNEPEWAFDCGFKLDFDGPIVDISSRFYPPKTHYGARWDGDVAVRVLGHEVARRSFEEDNLEALRTAAEAYVREYAERLRQVF